MEREEKNHQRATTKPSSEPEFVLQWGKRLRCVRVKSPNFSGKPTGGFRRKIISRIVSDAATDPSFTPFNRLPSVDAAQTSLDAKYSTEKGGADEIRNHDIVVALAVIPCQRTNSTKSLSGWGSEDSRKSGSPDKEERYYTTRGAAAVGEESGRLNMEGDGVGGDEKGKIVLPKLFISLSSKEKEEDFLAMKGCKLPQRPKKRAKLIQRTLLLVSPGAWLSDMCQERYEVREKRTPKKRPRGLKAMGTMDSDSE